MPDADDPRKPWSPEDLERWRQEHPRDELALLALAAWVNLSVEQLPAAMKAHTCPDTLEAWGRVAAAMVDFVEGRNKVQSDLEVMLIADNARMRSAGLKLSEAVVNVIRECDGLHRLSLAVAEWQTAIANEGGRGE